jgi:hypothetical protein
MCASHYQQAKLRAAPRPECSVEGCTERVGPHGKIGMCTDHAKKAGAKRGWRASHGIVT